MKMLLLCAAASALAACASSRKAEVPSGNTAFAEVGERFRHRVPFELGHTETAPGSAIRIDAVWGTRPTIEVGGSYLVTGTCSGPGKLYFWQTASDWDNSGPVIDTQVAEVGPDGRFALLHDMRGPGWFHLELHDAGGAEVADVYFGEGETLLRKKKW